MTTVSVNKARQTKKTKIQQQRRSYGNTVSLPSLKTKILCQTRFSTTAATVATGAIIWKPGFSNLTGKAPRGVHCIRLYCIELKNTFLAKLSIYGSDLKLQMCSVLVVRAAVPHSLS